MPDFCRYCKYNSSDEYWCDPRDPNVCGPCQHLIELETKIKEIRRVLVGLEKERQELKKKANHGHDRLIHRLPLEIASYIFELCIPEDIMDLDFSRQPPRYEIYTPLILSAVCTRWRTIAHSTPRLWRILPLRIYASDLDIYNMPVPLFNEWIDHAGEVPLSINLYVPSYHSWPSEENRATVETAVRSAMQMIKALNKCSHRWLNLKYGGPPSLLPHFSPDEQDFPLLQTLHLTNFDQRPFEETFKPRPRRLNTLSITANMIVAVDIDWRHLTQLELLEYVSLSECLEALRRATGLTRCTFRGRRGGGRIHNDFPRPRNPILQPELQYLEIAQVSVPYQNIFTQLLCPSLKTLVLDNAHNGVKMPLIVEFLKRSGCSLEKLSLPREVFTAPDITLLCQGIPTLQHLHVTSPALGFYHSGPGSPSRTLFACLAEYLVRNGKREPRYLPALRSLTWYKDTPHDPWSWTALPEIFGTPTAHSIDRHRHALESVAVSVLHRSQVTVFNTSIDDIDEETLMRILWLRDSAGVKWNITLVQTGVDMIRLGVDQYWG